MKAEVTESGYRPEYGDVEAVVSIKDDQDIEIAQRTIMMPAGASDQLIQDYLKMALARYDKEPVKAPSDNYVGKSFVEP